MEVAAPLHQRVVAPVSHVVPTAVSILAGSGPMLSGTTSNETYAIRNGILNICTIQRYKKKIVSLKNLYLTGLERYQFGRPQDETPDRVMQLPKLRVRDREFV